MINAIVDRHIRDVERVDALQTCNIVAILAGIGPPLMVRIDPTFGTEEVLRGLRVELVELEVLPAFHKTYSRKWD